MTADASFYDYVHPGHFMLFVEAARKFNCHILVRKTGAASISWMGKPGYTGKRGDLKAKTADLPVVNGPIPKRVALPLLLPDTPPKTVAPLVLPNAPPKVVLPILGPDAPPQEKTADLAKDRRPSAPPKVGSTSISFISHPIAGLVCSPFLRPESFSAERLSDARKIWMECRHLITEPGDSVGFDDRYQPTRCSTPYLVQTNPNHPHYGCVALVESGLIRPRYVHGDYDLFAIIPAGHAFDAETAHQHASERRMGTTVAPGHLGLAKREQRQLANFEGPLVFQLANFLNVRIGSTHPDLVGSLMVNHGEEVSWRKKKPDPAAVHLPGGLRSKPDTLAPVHYQPVLVIMPRMIGGQWGMILEDQKAHENFYLDA